MWSQQRPPWLSQSPASTILPPSLCKGAPYHSPTLTLQGCAIPLPHPDFAWVWHGIPPSSLCKGVPNTPPSSFCKRVCQTNPTPTPTLTLQKGVPNHPHPHLVHPALAVVALHPRLLDLLIILLLDQVCFACILRGGSGDHSAMSATQPQTGAGRLAPPARSLAAVFGQAAAAATQAHSGASQTTTRQCLARQPPGA